MFHQESYSTQTELDFIAGLGTHSNIGLELGHTEMVRRYRASITHRVKWDKIDQDVIGEAIVKDLKIKKIIKVK